MSNECQSQAFQLKIINSIKFKLPKVHLIFRIWYKYMCAQKSVPKRARKIPTNKK